MDTESAWARVQAQVAESFGVTLDERAGTSLMGLSAADVARDISRRAAAVAEQRGEPAPGFDAVYERLVRTEEDVVGEVLEPLPGAIETVRACAQRVPVAVASNSTRGILDRKMHAIGLADVVVTWVSAQDVPRGKPAPDIYEEAARRLGVVPADALAVEDSPAGTAAAVAAGLWVLGVPHGHDEPITPTSGRSRWPTPRSGTCCGCGDCRCRCGESAAGPAGRTPRRISCSRDRRSPRVPRPSWRARGAGGRNRPHRRDRTRPARSSHGPSGSPDHSGPTRD